MRQRQMGLESESNQGIGPRKKIQARFRRHIIFRKKNIFGETRKKRFLRIAKKLLFDPKPIQHRMDLGGGSMM